MSDDLNADLIGFEWTSEADVTYVVTGTWEVSPGYVVCQGKGLHIDFIRPAAVIRRLKQITIAA